MMWKALGVSVAGTAHNSRGGLCEDANCYAVFNDKAGNEVLAVCASDGAGSSIHAATASQYCVKKTVALLKDCVDKATEIDESVVFTIAETLYDELTAMAADLNAPIDAFYCTWLGAVVFNEKAIFFQIGDGAIARSDATDFFSTIWWPAHGEYLNITDFLVDDENLSNLQITTVSEHINEIAVFTDGIQMLCLNFDNETVHQPFFEGFFKHLRAATGEARLKNLEFHLGQYLDSAPINDRTDDDKTLFLASRR